MSKPRMSVSPINWHPIWLGVSIIWPPIWALALIDFLFGWASVLFDILLICCPFLSLYLRNLPYLFEQLGIYKNTLIWCITNKFTNQIQNSLRKYAYVWYIWKCTAESFGFWINTLSDIHGMQDDKMMKWFIVAISNKNQSCMCWENTESHVY